MLHAGHVDPKLLKVLLPRGLDLGQLDVEHHAGHPNRPLRGLDNDLPHHQPLLAEG
jgi:hypothetical protein